MAVRDTTIPDTMKAVRCHAAMDYRVEHLPVPTNLEPKQLLIKVLRCGICAGDSKCWRGAPRFWGNEVMPRYVRTPVTPGHEFVGTVVDAGDGALQHHGVEIGDLVTAEQVIACGTCLYCVKGLRWLCGPHDIFGFISNGGIGEYMVFPARAKVHRMARSTPAAEAVYVEPLSCAVHGVERAEISFGDTVVVSGCGPIGLGMIATARRAIMGGAPERLIALDYSDARLEVARECGADVCINAQSEDAVKLIREMTSGYGCDVYIEATGNPKSVQAGMDACRKAATFVEFSVFKKPTVLDWTVIGDLKELDIKGGHCSGDTGYQVAIDMIEKGSLPLDKIVTHGLPISDTINGLEMVDSGAFSAANSIKVTIDPTAE